MSKTHTILVFAQNKRGVLERMTGLIRKKMYNLEQITASDTEKEGVKRITITFSSQEGAKIPQILTQMNNIIEVIESKDVTNQEILNQEVGLIKIQRPKNILDLDKISDIFNITIKNVSQESVIIETVGSPKEINSVIEALKEFGIMELGRSGSVAMEI